MLKLLNIFDGIGYDFAIIKVLDWG